MTHHSSSSSLSKPQTPWRAAKEHARVFDPSAILFAPVLRRSPIYCLLSLLSLSACAAGEGGDVGVAYDSSTFTSTSGFEFEDESGEEGAHGSESSDSESEDESDDDGSADPEPFCGDGNVDEGEACDDANGLDNDACTNDCELAACGDGIVSVLNAEVCDDGDLEDQDGCDSDCQVSAFVSVSAGRAHSCALNRVGEVWCWGSNAYGQTGHGVLENLGDDEGVGSWGPVPLGEKAIMVETGALHTCALMQDGMSVRCWGKGGDGLLGQGNLLTIGDDESAAEGVAFTFSTAVEQLALGRTHSCARLEDGQVRCWGKADVGSLGVPGMSTIGDDELGSEGSAVQIDSAAVDISVGEHACAVVRSGATTIVRCWGEGPQGELGLGDPAVVAVGDDENPDEPYPVFLGFGVVAKSVAAGLDNSCAIVGETLRCWGEGYWGVNGNATIVDVGDDEGPLVYPSSALLEGEYPVSIELGESNACLLLEGGRVRCWGMDEHGLMGYSFVSADVGDNELASSASAHLIGPSEEGGSAVGLSVGDTHACVVTEAGTVRCWGSNESGQLGYGDVDTRGDEPGELGTLSDLPLWRI